MVRHDTMFKKRELMNQKPKANEINIVRHYHAPVAAVWNAWVNSLEASP